MHDQLPLVAVAWACARPVGEPRVRWALPPFPQVEQSFEYSVPEGRAIYTPIVVDVPEPGQTAEPPATFVTFGPTTTTMAKMVEIRGWLANRDTGDEK